MDDFTIFTGSHLAEEGHEEFFRDRWIEITNISNGIFERRRCQSPRVCAYSVRELTFSSNGEFIFLKNKNNSLVQKNPNNQRKKKKRRKERSILSILFVGLADHTLISNTFEEFETNIVYGT